MIQNFIQWKWRITDKMAFTAGLHNQYFSLGNSLSIAEPRIGWRLNMKKGQVLSVGAGMHSQTQPMYTYFYHQYDTVTGEKNYHNKDMDFSRSLHAVIGYEKALNKGLNFKTEAYYQYLYNIPVTIEPSSFSLINMGSGFSRFYPEPLENTGTGYNYGLEITLQKYFSKSFFFLLSGTIYASTSVATDLPAIVVFYFRYLRQNVSYFLKIFDCNKKYYNHYFESKTIRNAKYFRTRTKNTERSSTWLYSMRAERQTFTAPLEQSCA